MTKRASLSEIAEMMTLPAPASGQDVASRMDFNLYYLSLENELILVGKQRQYLETMRALNPALQQFPAFQKRQETVTAFEKALRLERDHARPLISGYNSAQLSEDDLANMKTLAERCKQNDRELQIDSRLFPVGYKRFMALRQKITFGIYDRLQERFLAKCSRPPLAYEVASAAALQF